MFQNIELFKTNTYLILLMVEWTLVLLFLQYLDFTKLTKGSSETNFNNAIKVQKLNVNYTMHFILHQLDIHCIYLSIK